jgi:hypothetical protein
VDLIIFTGFHKNGFSSNAENEGDFDCDSDDGEVDHDAETNELVSFENKLLDFIDSKGSRSTILKGVEAVAWLKKKYEGHENIQENVGHDKLTKRSLHVPTGTFTSSMGSLSMKVTDEVDSRDFEGESDSDEDDSDDYSLDSSSSFHDVMTNDIVYLQDLYSSCWVLPDATYFTVDEASLTMEGICYMHGSSKNNCLTLCQVRRSRTTTIL